MNIIAIMREAYMDFSRFEVEGLNRDYCSLYHQLEEESYTGDLLTNAAYGFTVYTERNFLTGNTRLRTIVAIQILIPGISENKDIR